MNTIIFQLIKHLNQYKKRQKEMVLFRKARFRSAQ